MGTYTVTISYYDGGSNNTLAVDVQANSKNDAFIIGASKAYAMFAGTECEILAVGVTGPNVNA